MKKNETNILNGFHITKQRISYQFLSLNQFQKPSTPASKRKI